MNIFKDNRLSPVANGLEGAKNVYSSSYQEKYKIIRCKEMKSCS